MCDALRRLNVDEHIITVIRNGYKKKTKLFVQDEYGKSEIKSRELELDKDAHYRHIYL